MEIRNIKNSYFYKLAYNPTKARANKKLIFDLKVVRQNFIESGLSTTEIEKEISALE